MPHLLRFIDASRSTGAADRLLLEALMNESQSRNEADRDPSKPVKLLQATLKSLRKAA